MVFFVVGDEARPWSTVDHMRIGRGKIPLHHFVEPVGSKHDMREFLGTRHGVLLKVSCDFAGVCKGLLSYDSPASCTLRSSSPLNQFQAQVLQMRGAEIHAGDTGADRSLAGPAARVPARNRRKSK